MNSEENNLITVSISDCFGDIGLVGIIGLRIVDCKGEFTDFIFDHILILHIFYFP